MGNGVFIHIKMGWDHGDDDEHDFDNYFYFLIILVESTAYPKEKIEKKIRKSINFKKLKIDERELKMCGLQAINSVAELFCFVLQEYYYMCKK